MAVKRICDMVLWQIAGDLTGDFLIVFLEFRQAAIAACRESSSLPGFDQSRRSGTALSSPRAPRPRKEAFRKKLSGESLSSHGDQVFRRLSAISSGQESADAARGRAKNCLPWRRIPICDSRGISFEIAQSLNDLVTNPRLFRGVQRIQ